MLTVTDAQLEAAKQRGWDRGYTAAKNCPEVPVTSFLVSWAASDLAGELYPDGGELAAACQAGFLAGFLAGFQAQRDGAAEQA